MGEVTKMTRPFDVAVCLSDDVIHEIPCTDLSISEDNSFLTLKTITGKERTYCLSQVLWWER